MRYCLFVFSIVLLTSSLISQTTNISEPLRFRVGVFGDYGINYHSTNFRQLPGYPNCCLNFRGGTGGGIYIGALAELPFSEKFLLSVRSGYAILNGDLIEQDNTKVLVNDVLTDGEFEHILNASLSAIKFDAMIGSEIYPRLFLYGGAQGALLLQTDFHQQELLTKPADQGVFTDTRQRVRNDTAGVIPQTKSFITFLKIGLSYELPLNQQGTLIAAPEIFYSYALADLVNGLPWKINTINIGVALKYSPFQISKNSNVIQKEMLCDTIKIFTANLKENKFVPGQEIFSEKKKNTNDDFTYFTEIYKRTDTLFLKQKSELEVKLITTAVYDDGSRKAVIDINIRQQFVTQAFTVLPFIFFEKNSSSLSSRYIKIIDTGNFDIPKLEANPLVYNHNTLNIIGKRLQLNPNSPITLHGFSDPVTENGNCELANSRAEEVRNYLTFIWNISKDRIKIIKSNKNCNPDIITQTQNEQGYDDNRHVMISTDDTEILAPIIKTRYLETIYLPVKAFEHQTDVNPKGNITEWKLTETQKDTTPIYTASGAQLPDIISQEINDRFADSVVSSIPLNVTINLKNSAGANAFAENTIKVNKDTSEFEIERLSLAIFKVARFSLRELDKRAIQNFIKDLRPGDTISVIGFTDSLGNEAENKTLSQSRAEAVCDYIKELPEYQNHKAVIIPCSGLWHTQKPPQIENYDSPEERFLSRIVQIEIRRRWR